MLAKAQQETSGASLKTHASLFKTYPNFKKCSKIKLYFRKKYFEFILRHCSKIYFLNGSGRKL
jgi:hypothetical protein